jgi:hypothetical protein
VWASERVARGATILMICLLLGGCATERDLSPVERLDPYSAVTTTLMAEPWVYARDVPALAANARDYLNVGVVETNRAGLRGYWLGVVAWSTIDRTALSMPVPPVQPAKVRFDWSDDSIELEPAPAGRKALGASQPIFAGPQPAFQDAWYLLSAAQLSRLAKQPPKSISLIGEGQRVLLYQPWRVDRQAMVSFLEATGFSTRALK